MEIKYVSIINKETGAVILDAPVMRVEYTPAVFTPRGASLSRITLSDSPVSMTRDEITTYAVKVANSIGVKAGYCTHYAGGKKVRTNEKRFSKKYVRFLRAGTTTSYARYRNATVNFSDYMVKNTNTDLQKHTIIHEVVHLYVDQTYGENTRNHGDEFKRAEMKVHEKFGYRVSYDGRRAYISELRSLDGRVLWSAKKIVVDKL